MALPTSEEIDVFSSFTAQNPARVLLSSCLTGEKCGTDGTSYGEYLWILKLMKLPNVQTVKFCPEQFAFGTPRNMPDIYGGNGFDVLDGRAKVLSDKGEDWTSGMLNAANEMLKLAKREKIDLAILMDMSAACGAQVISDGNRLVPERKYQSGPGVCAALLIREKFKVVSQRDYKTLGLIMKKLDASYSIDPVAIDHHETDWYKSYFKNR